MFCIEVFHNHVLFILANSILIRPIAGGGGLVGGQS